MLTRLRLKGFKSWPDTGDINLRPITGIFGTNSSGKTSLIQALLLLKQTADSPDRSLVFNFGDRKTPADLGDFHSTVHGHDANGFLDMAIDWKIDRSFKVVNSKNANQVVTDSEQLGFRIQAAQIVREMAYRVGDATFGMRRRSGNKPQYELFSDGTDFSFVHTMGRKWPLPAPTKCYGFPDQARAYFQNAGFVADLELALEERLKDVYYLGPLRAYPERRYTWTGAQPIDVGQAGEFVVDAILASRERGDKISRGRGYKRLTLEQYVAEWLKKLGLIHDFRVEPLAEGSPVFEVKVRRTSEAAEVLITDVGFGVSQILPVLVLCFYVPERSTVILEQPEIHLHPAVQAGLADILIDAWKKRRVQVILESHSEHLLHRLQRRLAENQVNEKNIGLYFCKAGRTRSNITELELDLFGNIVNWPQNFFGDQFGEIAAMSKAAQQRKRDRAS